MTSFTGSAIFWKRWDLPTGKHGAILEKIHLSMIKIPLKLTFDDVLLQPRRSSVSRSGVLLATFLTRKLQLDIPVISAAMDTVSELQMAIALGHLGGMAILHRSCSIEQQVKWIKAAKKAGVKVGAAVGPSDLQRAIALDKSGADVVVVDTAHGHSVQAIEGMKKIRNAVKAQLILGNIATAAAARDLLPHADAIKVGIGPGSICTTRIVAGIGVPQLSAIMDVVAVARKKNIPVIADGGIKYSGDAVKALAAGASCIMLGSMLAGTDESPGKIIKKDGQMFKSYRGMGYIGAHTIADMPKQANFVQITAAGLKESHPHSITISKKAPNY